METKLVNRQIHFVFLFSAFMFLYPITGLAQHSGISEEEVITIDTVMDSLIRQFNKVEDYTVKVKISVEMPRLRMPNKTIKLYFKQPDKVKIEADGFAVVPKSGLAMSPARIFADLFDLQVTGRERLKDRSYWIVEGTVNPDSVKFPVSPEGQEPGSYITSRFWVDPEGWVIERMETYVDTTKVLSIQTSYEEFDEKIRLPRLTEFRFNIEGKFFIGMADHGPVDPDAGVSREEIDFRGFVRLEFNRYRINRGLKDKIFKGTTF